MIPDSVNQNQLSVNTKPCDNQYYRAEYSQYSQYSQYFIRL